MTVDGVKVLICISEVFTRYIFTTIVLILASDTGSVSKMFNVCDSTSGSF